MEGREKLQTKISRWVISRTDSPQKNFMNGGSRSEEVGFEEVTAALKHHEFVNTRSHLVPRVRVPTSGYGPSYWHRHETITLASKDNAKRTQTVRMDVACRASTRDFGEDSFTNSGRVGI